MKNYNFLSFGTESFSDRDLQGIFFLVKEAVK
jgi:hypothetical protein